MEFTRTDITIQLPHREATTTGLGRYPVIPAPLRAAQAPARHSVRAQILQELRGALLRGTLRPGQVYSAPVLAERWGVSATPVREAMQQLVSEGTVEAVPNRGFRVAVLTSRDRSELAEVRAALMLPALLRLARSGPSAGDSGWAELRSLAEDTVAAAARGDLARYAEVDLAFHRAVLTLDGNRQLVTIAGELHRRAQCPSADGRSTDLTVLESAALRHGALLDALRGGDAATTERLVREHFSRC